MGKLPPLKKSKVISKGSFKGVAKGGGSSMGGTNTVKASKAR